MEIINFVSFWPSLKKWGAHQKGRGMTTIEKILKHYTPKEIWAEFVWIFKKIISILFESERCQHPAEKKTFAGTYLYCRLCKKTLD